MIQLLYDNRILAFESTPIVITTLETALIGVIICIFTKTEITKGIISGATFGFIGASGNYLIAIDLLGPTMQITNIIYAPLLGVFVSVLTKSNVVKGAIYGLIYSIILYIIFTVYFSGIGTHKYGLLLNYIIDVIYNSSYFISNLFFSILTNTLFSILIGMLINHKGVYIIRSIFGGVIYGVATYSVLSVSSNIMNMNNILACVLNVNYLFFILYPLTLQKTDAVTTMTDNDSTDKDSTYTTTTNSNSSVERDQVFRKGSKKWLYVISRTLIGAIIGIIIVYILMMINPNGGGPFGFFTDLEFFFELIVAVVYGGSGGGILGFLIGILSSQKNKKDPL